MRPAARVLRWVDAVWTVRRARMDPGRWRAAFASAMAVDVAFDRHRLWFGPALILGSTLHLSWRADPPLELLLGLTAVVVLAFIALRPHALSGALAFLALGIVLGGLAAEASVWRAAAPRIERALTARAVTGRVLRVEPRAERGPRVLLAVARIDGLAPAGTPQRIVMTGRWLAGLRVGQAVTVRARLVPVPGATHPGAYNPRLAAYFDRIGGYAFTVSRPQPASLPAPDAMTALGLRIEAWRTDLTERIVGRLGPVTGPIAAALVTGQRTAVTEDLRADFNASGLMHVLSISGLHMALVAGGVFWILRAIGALIPALALRWPLKKVAALGALATATFYEVASGAEVATTRSYIMIVVVFLAILCDRPAFTMRNLMIAVVLIVAWKPEAVMSASFQMSFAATAALVAGIERGWMPHLVRREQPWPVRALAAVAQAAAITAVVSLLCETAILPIQLHHFHRVVWFGLVGNVLATAVVDFMIMPMALLALLLVPLGIGDWVIPLLGFGVDRMIAIVRFVASFPGAVTPVAGFSGLSLCLGLAGVVWLVTWRTWIAALGLIPYLAAFALWMGEEPPVLRISPDGTVVAARGPDGRFTVHGAAADPFVVRRWLEADGDGRTLADPSLSRATRCDPGGCALSIGRDTLAMPAHPAALAEDCGRADLVITRLPPPPTCDRPHQVIRLGDVARNHGLAAWLHSGRGLHLTSVREACGARPWCPPPDEPARRRFAASAPRAAQ